jgi:hypothetical protein
VVTKLDIRFQINAIECHRREMCCTLDVFRDLVHVSRVKRLNVAYGVRIVVLVFCALTKCIVITDNRQGSVDTIWCKQLPVTPVMVMEVLY